MNVMKVFVFFGISIPKKGIFIDIFTYCDARNWMISSTQVYPIRRLWLSFLLIDVAGGKQKGRLASINHC